MALGVALILGDKELPWVLRPNGDWERDPQLKVEKIEAATAPQVPASLREVRRKWEAKQEAARERKAKEAEAAVRRESIVGVIKGSSEALLDRAALVGELKSRVDTGQP